MKESYVLKRRSGEIGGYIMARNGQLRARLPQGEGTVRIAAVYEDGIRTFEGKLDGLESVYPGSGKHLLGAYVCMGEKLLMDTGETARAAFEEAERQRAHARKPGSTRKSAQEENRRTEMRREAVQVENMETGATERRWPPPPCMPGAKYVNGAWRISQTAVR